MSYTSGPPQNFHPGARVLPSFNVQNNFPRFRPNSKQGFRHFIPEHLRGKHLGGDSQRKSPELSQTQGEQPEAQPEQSLGKTTIPLQNFRRNTFLRKTSRMIKISGVKPDMTADLCNLLTQFGDVVSIKMKWLHQGDIQVKFKDEK